MGAGGCAHNHGHPLLASSDQRSRRGTAPRHGCRWLLGPCPRPWKETAMTLSWPNHPITLEEWEALPEDSVNKLEVAEGMLVMSPRPLSRHQKAGTRLETRLDEQLPQALTALTDVEVVIAYDPLTIRAPDVLVTRTELFETDPPR